MLFYSKSTTDLVYEGSSLSVCLSILFYLLDSCDFWACKNSCAEVNFRIIVSVCLFCMWLFLTTLSAAGNMIEDKITKDVEENSHNQMLTLSMSLQGVRNSMGNLIEDRFPGQDLKPGPPDWEAGAWVHSRDLGEVVLCLVFYLMGEVYNVLNAVMLSYRLFRQVWFENLLNVVHVWGNINETCFCFLCEMCAVGAVTKIQTGLTGVRFPEGV